MSRPRIVLADDYKPLTSACEDLLQSDYDVVAVVASGEAALEAVCERTPDLLVLDITLPDVSGIEVAHRLARCGARTKIVMLTFHRDPAIIEQALAAGALGYVAKTRIARDLIPALRAALAGERYLSPQPEGRDAHSPES